jgi:hypothetical protein
MARFSARSGAQQIVHGVLYWHSVSASIDGTRSNSVSCHLNRSDA